MKKSFKARNTPSMIRSRIKKKKKLPTPTFYDPVVGLMHYNKNGRVVKD